MSAEVGGRLEAVAPRRSLFGPDYARLAILLAVAIAIHAWLVVHTAVPARDSLGFARVANNFDDPNAGAEPGKPRLRIDIIRMAEQPPGYPMAIFVAERVLRKTTDRPHPERVLLAAQLANAVAAVFLVVPMYLIGRILFTRNVGFATALLFQVLPVPARITSDGLSEGVYLSVMMVAILLGVRATRRPAVGGFLLCGLATGASYLIRPEGLLVAVGVGLVIGWAGLSRRWPRDLAAGRLTALLVGVALVALPYMLLIGKLTNKPTGSYITNPLDDQPARIWVGQPGARAPGAGTGPLFAKWWDPAKDAGTCRELWAIRAVADEIAKAMHFVVAGLAVIGLIAHRRQLFSPDPGLWVLVMLGFLSVLLMTYLATRIGYVSERHTLLFVMIACVFAAAALEPVAVFIESLPGLGRLIVWPKAAPGTILLTIVLAALPFTLKPMHPQREGHKHAGRWLAEHMVEGDWLIDPLAWGEWYAGRTLYNPPVCRGKPNSVWVIVESREDSPHSRLPLWEKAKTLADDREPVYRWSNPGHKGPIVEVYQLTYREFLALQPPNRGAGQ